MLCTLGTRFNPTPDLEFNLNWELTFPILSISPFLRTGTRSKIQQQLVLGRQTGSEISEPSHGPPFSLLTTLRPSSHHFLEWTEWFKRGWTPQEIVLSSRILAFTEDQAYWVCSKSTFAKRLIWRAMI